ncbi:AMP-binding enzyme [Nitzschia inconspicua]|uniref:AMP-binding enzyme n=1 Tax=Nitzschia inconspicua TaxID=303405 RepID=A0A9K3L135_9STRA|nr:AMP-binding enzyme [Nitzschia inconspicua]
MSIPSRLARGVLTLRWCRSATSRSAAASRWSPVSTTAAFNIQSQCMATVNGGSLLKKMATENPYKDVVRYEFKNRKWNLQHVDFYSDALATGFLDSGLQPGDVVLSWLPGHFSESMVLQFACSKSGLVLYNLDPSLATTDPEAAKEALAKALTLTKANVLISQEAGSDVNYVRLCESVIPEIRYFDFAEGKPFVTPRFPHLRFPIHTGFDQDDKWGMMLFKHFIIPSGNLDDLLKGFKVDGTTPLLGELVVDGKGIPTGTGKVKTNDEVAKSGTLETFSKILKKEFHTVDGVGVVW